MRGGCPAGRARIFAPRPLDASDAWCVGLSLASSHVGRVIDPTSFGRGASSLLGELGQGGSRATRRSQPAVGWIEPTVPRWQGLIPRQPARDEHKALMFEKLFEALDRIGFLVGPNPDHLVAAGGAAADADGAHGHRALRRLLPRRPDAGVGELRQDDQALACLGRPAARSTVGRPPPGQPLDGY